jgi:hypothetical protein
VVDGKDVPDSAFSRICGKLLLDAIHAVDAIDKEDEDKDEGDLGKRKRVINC